MTVVVAVVVLAAVGAGTTEKVDVSCSRLLGFLNSER